MLWGTGLVVALGLWSVGSLNVAHRFSCSEECGVFPDQRLNPCPLHWEVGSYPLLTREVT